MSASGIQWNHYIESFDQHLASVNSQEPWQIVQQLPSVIDKIISTLSSDYSINNGVAIHSSAKLEEFVVLKGPIIIGPNCFVAAHAYLRGGVYLIGNNSVGPGTEIKSSVLFPFTNLSHFNFVGDSILGSHVNMEAGSIIANHYNERVDKMISVKIDDREVKTGVEKFGALVGDRCKIGANAVLSPGTILSQATIVERLKLV
jgi:NDP-sugar pyrophosphorylase family protein